MQPRTDKASWVLWQMWLSVDISMYRRVACLCHLSVTRRLYRFHHWRIERSWSHTPWPGPGLTELYKLKHRRANICLPVSFAQVFILSVTKPQGRFSPFVSTNLLPFFFKSRATRLYKPIFGRSVGRSVSKLFKRRFTQNKDLSNVFECF